MLRDISGRPIRAGLDGWHSFALIPASSGHGVRGLEEIAALVAAGGMPSDTPVVHATKESPGGGLPEVRVAVPLSIEELRAWQHGDRTMAREIVEALEEAYETFLEQVKTGEVT